MTNAPLPPWGKMRVLAPGQRAQLRVVDTVTQETHLVFESGEVIASPNWTPDGEWLLYNCGGDLYRIDVLGRRVPEKFDLGGVSTCDDHLVSPDGSMLFVSGFDGHNYKMPMRGGAPQCLTNDHCANGFRHFLHGISPDGETLLYVGMTPTDAAPRLNIFAMSANGGEHRQLTDTASHDDGPEYSADGSQIYFCSQRKPDRPGRSQLYVMGADGSDVQPFSEDGRNNWYPHVSPDGQRVSYVSYAPDFEGRPMECDVSIRVCETSGGASRDVVRLFGGGSTINVNSWSPDSRRLAYVAFPLGRPD